MEEDKSIFKNDDIGAFGGRIKVDIDNPDEYIITRAEFQCGKYHADIENPIFPFYLKPTREDTKKFDRKNKCYLRVYDENGLRQTCKGFLVIEANDEVVKENGLCC